MAKHIYATELKKKQDNTKMTNLTLKLFSFIATNGMQKSYIN